MRHYLFRKEALSTLMSSGGLAEPLVAISADTWLLYAAIVVPTLALLMWSVLGRVESSRSCEALLIMANMRSDAVSPVDGSVGKFFVSPGDPVVIGQKLLRINNIGEMRKLKGLQLSAIESNIVCGSQAPHSRMINADACDKRHSELQKALQQAGLTLISVIPTDNVCSVQSLGSPTDVEARRSFNELAAQAAALVALVSCKQDIRSQVTGIVVDIRVNPTSAVRAGEKIMSILSVDPVIRIVIDKKRSEQSICIKPQHITIYLKGAAWERFSPLESQTKECRALPCQANETCGPARAGDRYSEAVIVRLQPVERRVGLAMLLNSSTAGSPDEREVIVPCSLIYAKQFVRPFTVLMSGRSEPLSTQESRSDVDE